MKKAHLYIETSVLNFYFADDALEKGDRGTGLELSVFVNNMGLFLSNRQNEL